jgi:hypothetical protein
MLKPSLPCGRLTVVQFEHPRQHGPETLGYLEALMGQASPPLTHLLFLADELVGHSHRDALLYINELRQRSQHSGIHLHCHLLERAWKQLRQHCRPEHQSPDLRSLFYNRNGFVFLQPRAASQKLLVIFTTMFNNYWVSTIALASILQRTGANLLILKDATRCNYHRGVESFAADLPGIAAGIKSAARNVQAEEIYISGFSSGGYAALLTSLMLPVRGYLGFSHLIDLSENSPLPACIHMPIALREQLNQQWFLDLRTMLENADPNVRRTLIYGALEPRDVAHARHIEGLKTIKTVRLPDAKHNTILPMVANEQLELAFNEMLDG